MASYDVGKKMDELTLLEGLADHELGVGSHREHLRNIFVPFVGTREEHSTLNICHLVIHSFLCSSKLILCYRRDVNKSS